MKSPRVSVVIPTRNYARFLPEAVASVQAQTFTSWEVVIVDDDSNDETPEVAKRLTGQDARITYVRIPHGGLSVARNTGIGASTAEFITHLDADDRWRATKLERQMELMDSEPEVGLCFTDMVRFNEEVGLYPTTQFSYVPELRQMPTRSSRGGDGRVLLLDPFEVMCEPRQSPCWVPTCMVRRSCLAGVQFPPGVRLCQDLVYLLLLLARQRSIAFIDEPLLEVRRHSANASERDRVLQPTVDALMLVGRSGLKLSHREALHRKLGRVWCSVGYDGWNRGQMLAASRGYWNALQYPGSRWSAAKHLAVAPLVALGRGIGLELPKRF